MANYEVVSPVQHDGEVFVPGDDLPDMDEDQLQALVDAGAVKEVEERRTAEEQAQAEADAEPPPNYVEPDLRLGSGDPSKPGAFNPAIDDVVLTNVPVTAPVRAEVGVTVIERQESPAQAINRKLREKAQELSGEEDVSLEDLKEEREQEQQQGADAQKQAQRGGTQEVSDEEREAAPRKQSTPRAGSKEQPSPAQSQASGR
jgi:hypothetical protein